MKKVLQQYKGFLAGVMSTVALSSLVAYAATSIQGLNVFTPGTTISAAAVNQNFERLAGVIQFQASSNTSSMLFTEADLFSNATACYSELCRKEKINMVQTVIDNPAMLISKVENNTTHTNVGGTFNYYKVTSDGWYELQLRAQGVSYSNVVTTCSYPGCNINLNFNYEIKSAKVDANGDIITDGYYLLNQSFGFSIHDSNNSSSFGDDVVNNFSGPGGEARKVYLKAGTVLFMNINFRLYATSGTATFELNIPANAAEFTVVKI